MFIFYNDRFDCRIVVHAYDSAEAEEKLAEFLENSDIVNHFLSAKDFSIQAIDAIIE